MKINFESKISKDFIIPYHENVQQTLMSVESKGEQSSVASQTKLHSQVGNEWPSLVPGAAITQLPSAIRQQRCMLMQKSPQLQDEKQKYRALWLDRMSGLSLHGILIIFERFSEY